MNKSYNRVVVPKNLDTGTSTETSTWIAGNISRRYNLPVVVGADADIAKDDLVVLGGVGGHEDPRIHQKLEAKGIDYVNVEKGYCNWWKPKFYRVCFNENQVTKIKPGFDNTRFNKFNMPIKKWQKGEQVYIVAPSQNGLDFYEIKKSVDEWIAEVETEVKKYTNRPIKIRKKGNKKSRGSRGFCDSLDNIYCVISLHTMAVTEALREGVPIISLIPGVLKDYSVDSISKINDLYYPSGLERQKVFNCLTSIQWSSEELSNGTFLEPFMSYYDLNILPKSQIR